MKRLTGGVVAGSAALALASAAIASAQAPAFPRWPSAPAPPKPRVVCGMTLIPAPPATDPKMPTPKRRDEQNRPRFTIRAVQPAICWP